MKSPEEYGYVKKNNILAFQKGPLSQWWGGFKDQNGGFEMLDFPNTMNWITSVIDPKEEMWVKVDEKLQFNCCEQWMMACKAFVFSDLETFDKIMKATNPGVQKNLGREVKNFDPKVWDFLKYEVVLLGNIFKYDQNDDCREFLMQFHEQTIFVEAAPWDKVWGNGLAPDDPRCFDLDQWQGENLLGLVKQQIRRSITH